MLRSASIIALSAALAACGNPYGLATRAVDAGLDAGPPAWCLLDSEGDVCAPYGLQCTAVGTSAFCELPTEGSPCLARVGCASPGLSCLPLVTPSGHVYDECLLRCEQTDDCTSIVESCQPTPIRVADGGTESLLTCAGVRLRDALDHERIRGRPVRPRDPGRGRWALLGRLLRARRTASAGQACAQTRTDAGLASVCDADDECVASFDSTTQSASAPYACVPWCDSADGGRSCSPEAISVITPTIAQFNQIGDCAAACETGADCPAGFGCLSGASRPTGRSWDRFATLGWTRDRRRPARRTPTRARPPA